MDGTKALGLVQAQVIGERARARRKSRKTAEFFQSRVYFMGSQPYLYFSLKKKV
jgi:hypothetical protein